MSRRRSVPARLTCRVHSRPVLPGSPTPVVATINEYDYSGGCAMLTPTLNFVDPFTKLALRRDSEGNLFCEEGGRRQVYRPLHGCYDFVLEGLSQESERAHYEAHYQGASLRALDLDDIRGLWFDRCTPWYNTLLHSMGELQGKTVLLVGNGRSCKEFYFTACGAHVVFTDFSLEAVLRASASTTPHGPFYCRAQPCRTAMMGLCSSGLFSFTLQMRTTFRLLMNRSTSCTEARLFIISRICRRSCQKSAAY